MITSNIEIFKNGRLIEKGHNTVHNDLKSYLIGLLDAASNSAIDDLFDEMDVTSGSTQAGKDGIVAVSSSRGERTMLTTTLSPSQTHGKKWRGEYTNNTGGSETITDFALGHDFNSTSNPYFDVQYANYNPADIAMDNLDTIVLQWEVFISS